MKEEPGTKFYFDGKIARVVFVADVERKAYWVGVDITDFPHRNYMPHHNYFNHMSYYLPSLLPIEEWLEEQGMTCVEDDMCLFELTWL